MAAAVSPAPLPECYGDIDSCSACGVGLGSGLCPFYGRCAYATRLLRELMI